jgi:hypothetical protein
VNSPRDAHPGIGGLEKSHEQEDRVLREKAQQLAKVMWEQAGRPAGGVNEFIADAFSKLRDAIGP